MVVLNVSGQPLIGGLADWVILLPTVCEVKISIKSVKVVPAKVMVSLPRVL
jgi:hypothetical protein